MTYKSVVAAARGSSDVLKIMENDRREPVAGEVVSIAHKIGPFLTLAGVIMTMYLLADPRP